RARRDTRDPRARGLLVNASDAPNADEAGLPLPGHRFGDRLRRLRRPAVLRHPIALVVTRRLVLSIPLLFIVSVLVFVLMSIVPGNVVQAILGAQALEHSSSGAVHHLEHQLGIDR